MRRAPADSFRDLYAALGAHGRAPLPIAGLRGQRAASPAPRPSLAEFADAIAALLQARRVARVDIHAVGFGAALALELNRRHPDRVGTLALTGLLRAGPAERAAMIGRLAPRIELADDGSHWYRTWLMLRDSLVRWPWYVRDVGSLRRQPLVFDAGQLHAWTSDVMRQWNSYHHLVDAVLRWDAQPALAAADSKLILAVDEFHALNRSDVAWALSAPRTIKMPPDAAGRATLLRATFAQRAVP